MGGAYLKKQDQIINVGMIRYASSEDTQGRASNLRSFKVKWGRLLIVRETVASAEGFPPPQKSFKSESLRTPFPSTFKPIYSCIKKVPKIDGYFLNFDKRGLSSAVIYLYN